MKQQINFRSNKPQDFDFSRTVRMVERMTAKCTPLRALRQMTLDELAARLELAQANYREMRDQERGQPRWFRSAAANPAWAHERNVWKQEQVRIRTILYERQGKAA